MSDTTEKTLELYTQEAVAYTPVSMTPGAACSNCRWFIGAGQGGASCWIMNNYPLDVTPNGYCNEHSQVEVAIAQNEAPMMGMEDVGTQEMSIDKDNEAAHGETAHEHDLTLELDSIYIAANEDGVLKSLTNRLRRGLKPGASVFKGADGKRYMLIVTSNSYKDRDEETITTSALQTDVDKGWIADDLFHSDNPLLYWHDDRLPIGQIVYADVKTPFLVELAREAENAVAKSIFDYREQHPAEKWGASHRFAYFKKDRASDGTYKRIFKQETSILPREAAANLLTFSGVIPMPTKRDEYLNKILGLSNAAELLDKGIDVVVSELKKQNVEHKSAGSSATLTVPFGQKPAALAAVQEAEKEFGSLMIQLIDSQAELLERQDTLESGVTGASKSVGDETAALKAQVKALTDKVAQLETQLDNRPRSASRAIETEIEKKDMTQQLQDSLTTRDPMWGLLKPEIK